MARDLYFVAVVGVFIALAVVVPALFFRTRRFYAALLPELDLFDSPADRRRAFLKAVSSFDGNAWLALMAFGLMMGLWMFIRRNPWLPDFSASLILHLMVFAFAPYLVVVACFFILFRGRLRRSLQRQLSQRGSLVCGHCDYDLRGQSEPRCPECGQPMNPAQVAALKEAAGS